MSSSDLSSCIHSLKRLIADSENETSDVELSKLFDSSILARDLIDASSLSTTDEEFQDAANTCIKALEKCTLMVNELELFSSNESIDELQTSSMRYLILPAVLGSLTLVLQSMELTDRLKNVQISEAYFQDFLLRCKNYELPVPSLKYFDDELEEEEKSTTSDPSNVRERKIQQFKRKKELEDKEKTLKKALGKHYPEEYIREYSLVVLEKWVLTAVEELENVKKEQEILKFIPQKENTAKSKRNIKPLKPIIITKNEVQKRVFGLGYPSIPVLTIDDWYRHKFEKMVNDHKSNPPGSSLQDRALSGGGSGGDNETEEIEKEELAEKDDFAALMKARQWDDWKDCNPRGSGNRYNKG